MLTQLQSLPCSRERHTAGARVAARPSGRPASVRAIGVAVGDAVGGAVGDGRVRLVEQEWRQELLAGH